MWDHTVPEWGARGCPAANIIQPAKVFLICLISQKTSLTFKHQIPKKNRQCSNSFNQQKVRQMQWIYLEKWWIWTIFCWDTFAWDLFSKTQLQNTKCEIKLGKASETTYEVQNLVLQTKIWNQSPKFWNQSPKLNMNIHWLRHIYQSYHCFTHLASFDSETKAISPDIFRCASIS